MCDLLASGYNHSVRLGSLKGVFVERNSHLYIWPADPVRASLSVHWSISKTCAAENEWGWWFSAYIGFEKDRLSHFIQRPWAPSASCKQSTPSPYQPRRRETCQWPAGIRGKGFWASHGWSSLHFRTHRSVPRNRWLALVHVLHRSKRTPTYINT